jgi:hypothetical protein
MGLGTSLFLIALGAILDFAVDATVPGFSIHAVGLILMLVGAVGAVLSLFYWNEWGGFHGRGRTVYHQSSVHQPVVQRTAYESTPVVAQPVVSQPVVTQPVVAQPVAGQPVVSQVQRRVVEEEIS